MSRIALFEHFLTYSSFVVYYGLVILCFMDCICMFLLLSLFFFACLFSKEKGSKKSHEVRYEGGKDLGGIRGGKIVKILFMKKNFQ